MKPELRPISITIVDFLGVFLPGTVWLVLLATFCHFILENFKPEITPIWEIKNLLKSFPSYSSILLLLFSIIIGYLIKPVSTPVAEFCYSIPPYLWKTFRCNLSDNGFDIRKWVRVVEQNDFKLPFTKEHKKDKDGKEIEYYKFIVSLINTNFKFENKINELDIAKDATELIGLPKSRTQPFSVCKRILREISPTLWEEAERREAEVRMFGSFFSAAIFSLIISAFSLWHNWQSSSVWMWFILSFLTTSLLRFSFGKQKRQEVMYVYMNFLVANSEFSKKLKTDSKDTLKNE